MAGSPKSTLGLVREFLLNVLRAEDRQMKEDEAIIEQYKVDTKKVQQKIQELRSGAVTFQASHFCHSSYGDIKKLTYCKVVSCFLLA